VEYVLFVLLIILMVLGVFAIIGNTNEKPWPWGGLTLIFGLLYAWLLITWTNFVLFIWIPAWETFTTKRTPGTYEIGAVILLLGMGFYIIMMVRTAYVSWTKEGIIRLAA